MARYDVVVIGTFEDEFCFIEAQDENDAKAVAIEEFQSIYKIDSGSDWSWDSCEVTYIKRTDEEGNDREV